MQERASSKCSEFCTGGFSIGILYYLSHRRVCGVLDEQTCLPDQRPSIRYNRHMDNPHRIPLPTLSERKPRDRRDHACRGRAPTRGRVDYRRAPGSRTIRGPAEREGGATHLVHDHLVDAGNNACLNLSDVFRDPSDDVPVHGPVLNR